MDLHITLIVKDLRKDVGSLLAYVGKRVPDKKGDPLFSGATMSSAETAVTDRYIRAAVHTLVTDIHSPLLNMEEGSGYDTEDGHIETPVFDIIVGGDRWPDSRVSPFEWTVKSFIVSYTANALLAKTTPDLAKGFADDAAMYLKSAVNFVYDKKPPTAQPYGVADMNGQVILDDDNN